MRALVAGTVALALLTAGCSDDGDAAVMLPGESTTTADGSTVDTAADQRIADEAVLVASDLPAGWAAEAGARLDNMENLIDECGAEDSSRCRTMATLVRLEIGRLRRAGSGSLVPMLRSTPTVAGRSDLGLAAHSGGPGSVLQPS